MDELETFAAALLDSVGCATSPTDPLELALRLGLTVRPGPLPAMSASASIVADVSMSPVTMREDVAVQVARVLLRERRVSSCPVAVAMVARALALPRQWLRALLAELGPDLGAIAARCPLSSAQAVGRRIVDMGGAVLWSSDGRRWLSRDVPAALEQPTQLERELITRAARDRAPVRQGNAGAWPDGSHILALSVAAELQRH